MNNIWHLSVSRNQMDLRLDFSTGLTETVLKAAIAYATSLSSSQMSDWVTARFPRTRLKTTPDELKDSSS